MISPRARLRTSQRMRDIAGRVRNGLRELPGKVGRMQVSQELNEYLQSGVISWTEYSMLMKEFRLDTPLGTES